MRLRYYALILVLCLVAAVPVRTVTNGEPDGNRHPYVGVLIQFIPNTDLVAVCSGSALSRTRFLTAAHCADPSLPVFVSYKPAPPFSLSDFTEGTFHPHPGWCVGCAGGLPGFDSNDIAVVALNKPKNPGAFAVLPTSNLVDSLPNHAEVDVVGYGTQGFIRGGGPPTEIFLFTRYFAPSLLSQGDFSWSDEFIRLTANPAKGKGGICFGDSGGPDLLGDTNVVLAVNSYVTNGNCSGVTYSQRVDLPAILDFIRGV
jgi:trypsin